MMLPVGSRLSCTFTIMRSDQFQCLPFDLMCLDAQFEEQLKGKMFFNSSGGKYNPASEMLESCVRLLIFFTKP